jgi:hypothetical protein
LRGAGPGAHTTCARACTRRLIKRAAGRTLVRGVVGGVSVSAHLVHRGPQSCCYYRGGPGGLCVVLGARASGPWAMKWARHAAPIRGAAVSPTHPSPNRHSVHPAPVIAALVLKPAALSRHSPPRRPDGRPQGCCSRRRGRECTKRLMKSCWPPAGSKMGKHQMTSCERPASKLVLRRRQRSQGCGGHAQGAQTLCGRHIRPRAKKDGLPQGG